MPQAVPPDHPVSVAVQQDIAGRAVHANMRTTHPAKYYTARHGGKDHGQPQHQQHEEQLQQQQQQQYQQQKQRQPAENVKGSGEDVQDWQQQKEQKESSKRGAGSGWQRLPLTTAALRFKTDTWQFSLDPKTGV